MTSRTKALASTAGLVTLVGAVSIYVRGSEGDAPPTAVVRQGAFAVTLTEAGVLRAAESVTFRSPLEGRETEIVYLAPEGSEVRAGDLLVRLDTTALKAELERATQAVRQVEMELQAAEVDREEATLTVTAATEGAGALLVEEARTNHWLAQAKANRLREEHLRLKPLLEKGFVTREELERAALEAEEAAARAQLAERALTVLVERTRPAEEQSARLQLARRRAQIEHLKTKLATARVYERSLAEAIAGGAIHAPRPGLVVYDENFGTTPRRKVRVGDRVTAAQGLVILPDLRRMRVEATVRESDVHMVRPGQPARVRLDAFPDRVLHGTVARLGALAQARASGDARFDLAIDLTDTLPGLRPGMSARVDVVVAERSDALVVPLTAVFTRDDLPVCYVRRGSRVEARTVELGKSNDAEIEILAGLRANERVLLLDPRAR